MQDLKISTEGMDILTDTAILEKSLGTSVPDTQSASAVTQDSENFLQRNSYNPVNMGMEWAENFKLGWNHIKEKMREEDELEQLSQMPLTQLSKTDQERVYKYAIDKKTYTSKILSPLGEDIRDSVVESFVGAAENVKSFEFYRPEQGIIDIMNSPEIDNLDKLESSLKVITDVAYNNTVGNFDKEEYMQITGEYANSAAEKIKTSFDEDLGTTDRFAALGAGTIEFLFAPIGSLFDERNSGAITATVGQGLDSTMVVLRSTVTESAKSLGFSDATAENLSILSESLIPSKIAKDKMAGVSESVAMKNAIGEIKQEIKNLYGLDPAVRDAYIAAKNEQYGNFMYTKGVEQFDSILEEARQNSDIAKLETALSDIKKYNSEVGKQILGDIKSSAAIQLDNLASGIGAKLSFIDNGKEVPYLDLSKIGFGRGADKLVQQDVTKNALSDLSSFWAEKGLADLKKAEIKASVDQYLKETGLSQVQKNTFTNNLIQELALEREKQKISIENLHKIAVEKSDLRDKYMKAKDDIYNGIISDKEFSRAKKAYQKSLDTVTDSKKFDEIKYQEAIGNIKEVGTEDGLTLYNWTDKGLKYLKPEMRSVSQGYHFPTKLKNDIEAKADGKIVQDIVDKKNMAFEDLLTEKTQRVQNPLKRGWKKSGLTWDKYVSNQVGVYLAKKERMAQIEMELDAAKGERRFTESDYGGAPDVKYLSSFPSWIPQHLRKKRDLEKVWKKLSEGKLDIPDRYKNQQEMMSMFLDRLGSPLAYLYEADWKTVSKNKNVELNRELRGKLQQSKQVLNAIHREYKKKKTEVRKTSESLEKARERVQKVRTSWKQKYLDKAASNKNRRAAVRALQSAFELTDAELKKVTGNKDYFTFENDYQFKQWLYNAEEKAYTILERKFEMQAVQAKIQNKELNNVKNLLRAYEFPVDFNKMTVDDLLRLDKILDGFEQGDTFITPGLIKRFDVVGEENIRTVREARESIAKDLGEYFDMDLVDLESSLYGARIRELREQLKDADTPEARSEIEVELKEVEKAQAEMEIKQGVKDENLRPKSEKNTDETVTEDKLIKGNYWDKLRYDTALANQNPLYKYMVIEYNNHRLAAQGKVQKIRDELSEKLGAARKSRPGKTLKDKLIPTDDLVFEYLEAGGDKKVELGKKLTVEELDLANYVADMFATFRNHLEERKVMDNFRNNYVTNLQKDWKEILKTRGLKDAVKSIFNKQESTIDFGALGDTDTVLGFEKFFKFSLQRTKDFDPSKDMGKAVMAYVHTFYKKEALDQVIPKVALYKNLIADSKADKFVVQWLNNKKGITALPELQGTTADKVVSGLKTGTALLDLGFNPITAGASMGGVGLSNFIALGVKDMGKGMQRKYTAQGKKILKNYEAEIGRNPLWDVHKEVLAAPDVPPLEKPGQLAFVMLGQTLQSGLNTAFLAKLTKAEFSAGEVSPKRIAQIMNELGAVHALPGSHSVYGSTFIGKLFMMYKSWAVPLVYTNGRNARKIMNGTATNADKMQFVRGIVVPSMILYMGYKIMGEEDPDDKFAYHKKRILQELTSTIGAMDLRTWLAIPRPAQFIKTLYENTLGLAQVERYKTTKDGEYEEGDLKFWNQMERLLTPGAIKALKVLGDEPKGKSSDRSGDINFDLDFGLGDLDLDTDLDLSGIGDLDLDLGSLDLDL